METFQTLNTTLLNSAGLNRQAVFDFDSLPPDITAPLQESCHAILPCRQLILIGHAGRRLWEAIRASGIKSEDPIDDFTVQTVRQWFAQCQPHHSYEILYPGPQLIGLQRLGELAGWHHAAPFMVGIDKEWGSWFAYRAVVVANTAFEPSKPVHSEHPCASCDHRICIANCPAGAMDEGKFDLAKCVAYRKQADSRCKATCLARVSCPVGSVHRYSDEQIHHSYSRSMQVIEQYY